MWIYPVKSGSEALLFFQLNNFNTSGGEDEKRGGFEGKDRACRQLASGANTGMKFTKIKFKFEIETFPSG